MSTIHERIKDLVKQVAGGKNTVFANKLGVNESNIRAYINGVIPKADILSLIVTSYDVSSDWLLTGKGDMFNTSTSSPNAIDNPFAERLLSVIEQKDKLITVQAQEIGQLKERLLKQQRIANSVTSEGTVHVG